METLQRKSVLKSISSWLPSKISCSADRHTFWFGFPSLLSVYSSLTVCGHCIRLGRPGQLMAFPGSPQRHLLQTSIFSWASKTWRTWNTVNTLALSIPKTTFLRQWCGLCDDPVWATMTLLAIKEAMHNLIAEILGLWEWGQGNEKQHLPCS